MPSRVLELNASDERGISIIRTKVKDFSRLQLSNAPVNEEYRKQYPCPPFRICILDEADALSQDAQSALRRVLEIHSRTTRFCLIANYVSKIISPIASRCSKFRFKTLAGADAGSRLVEIAEKEHVKYENGVIEKLLEVSEGDMRRAVTYLQSSFNLTSAAGEISTKRRKVKRIEDSDDSDETMTDASTVGALTLVTIATVEEVAGIIPPAVIRDLVAAMQPRKAGHGSVYTALSKQVTDMVADGWSANQVLSQLYNVLVADETMDLGKKTKCLSIFSEMDKSLLDGTDEHLATLDLSLRLAAVLGGEKK
jgi:replication factor C subunit 2/4